MDDGKKREIAHSYIEIVRRRDAGLLAATTTEDVMWTLPGSSRMSGEARGRDGIMRRLETFAEYGVDVDLRHVMLGRDDVAVALHNTGERDGIVLDEYLTTVCHLRDGRIHRLETFLTDVEMLDRFFV